MFRILLIEDDKIQNDVLSNFLKKEGYLVTSVYSLGEARSVFDENISLVVLDIMLPDGNGLTFLREIREQSNVPVIMLTALGDEYTQLKSFDFKADEYVEKPASPSVMVKRVGALLKRTYGGNANVCINGVQLDFEKYVAFDATGKDISLTTLEWKIMQLLYKYKGAVIPRQNIMDQVWGMEYIAEDRLIDTHIKNIRKKLGNDAIVTVKGIGYRIGGNCEEK